MARVTARQAEKVRKAVVEAMAGYEYALDAAKAILTHHGSRLDQGSQS